MQIPSPYEKVFVNKAHESNLFGVQESNILILSSKTSTPNYANHVISRILSLNHWKVSVKDVS